MSPLLLTAIFVLIGAVVLEVVIPRIGEVKIERRLTDRGGDAYVALEAFPAILLLQHRGERIEVKGRNIAVGTSKGGGGLTVLDGFRHVEIGLQRFTTGPFEVEEFALSRHGGGNYLMRSEARTTSSALADFSVEPLGQVGAGLIGLVARGSQLGDVSFTVSVEVELESEGGLLRIVDGDGTIGGYPAGPIATLIAAAVARRLEIVY